MHHGLPPPPIEMPKHPPLGPARPLPDTISPITATPASSHLTTHNLYNFFELLREYRLARRYSQLEHSREDRKYLGERTDGFGKDVRDFISATTSEDPDYGSAAGKMLANRRRLHIVEYWLLIVLTLTLASFLILLVQFYDNRYVSYGYIFTAPIRLALTFYICIRLHPPMPSKWMERLSDDDSANRNRVSRWCLEALRKTLYYAVGIAYKMLVVDHIFVLGIVMLIAFVVMSVGAIHELNAAGHDPRTAWHISEIVLTSMLVMTKSCLFRFLMRYMDWGPGTWRLVLFKLTNVYTAWAFMLVGAIMTYKSPDLSPSQQDLTLLFIFSAQAYVLELFFQISAFQHKYNKKLREQLRIRHQFKKWRAQQLLLLQQNPQANVFDITFNSRRSTTTPAPSIPPITTTNTNTYTTASTSSSSSTSTSSTIASVEQSMFSELGKISNDNNISIGDLSRAAMVEDWHLGPGPDNAYSSSSSSSGGGGGGSPIASDFLLSTNSKDAVNLSEEEEEEEEAEAVLH